MSAELYEFVATISGWVIAILVAACAYFLKQVADDIKETRKTVASHSIMLAGHNVMYELWLEEIGLGSGEHPNRRETDKIRAIIAEITKPKAAGL